MANIRDIMDRIDMLQAHDMPVVEEYSAPEPSVNPLLQAMRELQAEGIVEAKESIKDQLEKAYLQDGGSIDEYFVRSSKVDKLGFSPKQIFARSPDLDHPAYDIDYIGNSVGTPALWFYPLSYYLKSSEVFTKGYPYIWLVKLKPNAWLQPVDRFTKTKQEAPQGKERVGILRKTALSPSAIFFKPAFEVVDKFFDYGGQHKRHGEVKGAPVEEEIAYHGTVDDINEFHPFTHFGTEKAAKDRMEYKKIKDGKIYKVDLDIKNPLKIKDFPGIHYDRLYAFELRDKGLISQDEMEAITFIQDKQELRKALLNKLSELGIDGFVYKNKYEDKGNISYVIVDPSQVKVLSVEPATEAVTEASDNKVAYHVTPTQNLRSVMKNGLVPNVGDRSSKIAGELSGIYLFPSVEAAEDAVMNWLGDEFDEDEPLTLLKVNIDGLEKYISQGADYELIVNTDIEPSRIHKLDTQLEEASPDTLEGSFTPDLVESKTWLAKMLAKGLKGKNAGTIYVLGSWYGNMGIFLQQAGVKFDKLVLVEPDEEALMRSKDLLQQLNDDGKLILIHQKAEDIVYEKPGVVINTSCNETGPVFLTKLPDNMLCLLQARNNNEDSLFPTEQLEDFVDYFPLAKVYYTGEKHLEDPEVNYVRFMKIGRSGKKLDETASTGLGGGSAGNNGGPMVGGPKTYEEEYGMFKSKGPRKIMAMTEALDSSYEYHKRYNTLTGADEFKFKTEDDVSYTVSFSGDELVGIVFSAILPGEEDNFRPDKTGLTGTGNSRKVFGTVVKIVQDFIGKRKPKAIYFTADTSEPSRVRLYDTMVSQVDKALPDYYASKSVDLGSGKVYMLKRKTDAVNEALDSSYPYEFENNAYYFTTDAGNDYKVMFNGNKKVEVSFVSRDKAGQVKDTATGSGDSRKVFGTVIDIVKDYVSKHNPEILMFAAVNNEPSRVRLYNMLASQAGKALPGYNFAKTLKNSMLTSFYLTRDNIKVPKLDTAKNALNSTLDKVFEDSITLNKLYGDNKPDRDDTIWDYGTMIWDNEYPIETINPNKLNLYLQSQYRVEHIEELFDMMNEEQQEIVDNYVNDPTLSDKIIVLDNGYIVDGNHRALAAVLANKPIKYVDIGEEDEQ